MMTAEIIKNKKIDIMIKPKITNLIYMILHFYLVEVGHILYYKVPYSLQNHVEI